MESILIGVAHDADLLGPQPVMRHQWAEDLREALRLYRIEKSAQGEQIEALRKENTRLSAELYTATSWRKPTEREIMLYAQLATANAEKGASETRIAELSVLCADLTKRVTTLRDNLRSEKAKIEAAWGLLGEYESPTFGTRVRAALRGGEMERG